MARRHAGLPLVALCALAGCGSPPVPTTPVEARAGPTIEAVPATEAQLRGPWSPVPFTLPAAA